MKIISIVGVRPQFIKLFPVSRALSKKSKKHQEIIIHTGQHYDDDMSAIFLRELAIPSPHYQLHIGAGSHAEQTGRMLMAIEKILVQEKPDKVIVFGDTNSTLAGALAAAKLHIPIAHIEAGMRSRNRMMPEEINRLMTDHLAQWLFCPTASAMHNLAQEGIQQGVHWVGDVMFDAALYFADKTNAKSLLADLQIKEKQYLLATIHRAANTERDQLTLLLDALAAIDETIILPLHPRTRDALAQWNLSVGANIRVINPVGYFAMLTLEKNARMILTDSGGVQKEAFFFGIPCITLRTETEWTELVELGWNKITGLDKNNILSAVKEWQPRGERSNLFGDGNASEKIVEILENA